MRKATCKSYRAYGKLVQSGFEYEVLFGWPDDMGEGLCPRCEQSGQKCFEEAAQTLWLYLPVAFELPSRSVKQD